MCMRRFAVAGVVIRAERKLGEIVTKAKEEGQLTHAHDPRHKSVVDGDDNRFTLADAGISRDVSSRSQKPAGPARTAGKSRQCRGGSSERARRNHGSSQ